MEELHGAETSGKSYGRELPSSFEDTIEACFYLMSALKGIAARSTSPELRDVLGSSLKNVAAISYLHSKKEESAGMRIDSRMLSGAAKELEALARNEDFWKAFDALLAAQSRAGYPGILLGRQMVGDRQKMAEYLKNQIDLFNRLALENFPVEPGSKAN